jgi:hypothetical protein
MFSIFIKKIININQLQWRNYKIYTGVPEFIWNSFTLSQNVYLYICYLYSIFLNYKFIMIKYSNCPFIYLFIYFTLFISHYLSIKQLVTLFNISKSSIYMCYFKQTIIEF